MPKIKINGEEVDVEPGMTVLQACEQVGIEIPRFCYHERLSIAGNCRMCLVEVSPGPPKPQASCALPVAEKMEVKTNTPMVKKAREGVMEFLLINHPLDCPICDQAGECDLQDQAMAYGSGNSRYKEPKRSVPEKNFGPLIQTFMTRCIHCTRCVRFATEVAGVPVLGGTSRGEHMEIGTYVEKSINSELSGNLVDLCPVGALTSKPYAYKARPWELKKTESIDVMDAVGSNIVVGARGNEVLRILPRINEEVNEEWISDKTRYACDGLTNQRLDRPYVKKNGKLKPASWREAYNAVSEALKDLNGKEIAAIAGDFADAEAMFALKTLMENLGSPNLDCRQDGAKIDNKVRAGYLFNSGIAGIDQADVCLLIGTNPRWEAPIINSRLRKRYVAGGFKIANIGPALDLTFPVENLGEGTDALTEILEGKSTFSKTLKAAKNPIIIVGSAVFARKDALAILDIISEISEKFGVVKEGWNGYNALQRAASRVAGLDMGFLPQKGGEDTDGIVKASEAGRIKAIFLLGADELDMKRFGEAFVVYIGTHGDAGAHRADVILPACAYTEKNAIYINTEGRPQKTKLAVFAPGEAKEDWRILVELAEELGKGINFSSLKEVRKALFKAVPHIEKFEQITPTEFKRLGKAGKMLKSAFEYPIKNFYMTDPISRASKTMAECTSEFIKPEKLKKEKVA